MPACDLGTIPVGGTAGFDITVTVNPSAAEGTITNEATVSYAGTDTNPSNDTALQDTLVLRADYGDMPDSPYPTLLVSDGARHMVPLGGAPIVLGALIDTEPDGQPSVPADLDDLTGLADEDGVVFLTDVEPGGTVLVDVTVTGIAGLLNAWVDFDQDGAFLDPREQIFVDEPVAPGTQGLGFVAPLDTSLGNTYARFRVDTGGGLEPSGRAFDGEVEDYPLAVLPNPVLSLTKDDGGITAVPGGLVVYTLTAINTPGAATANWSTLTDVVPVGTAFDEAASGGPGVWSCIDGSPAGSECERSVADLSGGADHPSSFGVTVDPSLPAGMEEIANTAVVEAANAAPANAVEQTPVDATPDLTMEKDDGGATATAGGGVVYTLTCDNVGNQNASGVVITETVPFGSSFDPSSSTPGWAAQGGGVYTLALGVLPVGGGSTPAFAVVVDDPVPAGLEELANAASIADDGAGGADPNPDDNSDEDTTPIDAAPVLALVKDDGGIDVDPGSTVIYGLDYENTGDQDASGVEIEDAVPAGTTFDAAASSPGWDCLDGDPEGTPCTIVIGSVPGGTSGVVEFAAEVAPPQDAPDEIFNTATAHDDGDGTGGVPVEASDSDTTPVNDLSPPTIDNVDTILGNGDGVLEECESVGNRVRAYEVTFSEAMFNPAGNGHPNDVTNPANYQLIGSGPDLDLSTESCGGAVGDDVAVGIDSVSYDAQTLTALVSSIPRRGSKTVRIACLAAAGGCGTQQPTISTVTATPQVEMTSYARTASTRGTPSPTGTSTAASTTGSRCRAATRRSSKIRWSTSTTRHSRARCTSPTTRPIASSRSASVSRSWRRGTRAQRLRLSRHAGDDD